MDDIKITNSYRIQAPGSKLKGHYVSETSVCKVEADLTDIADCFKVCLYAYMFICMCVCACVRKYGLRCVGEREANMSDIADCFKVCACWRVCGLRCEKM